LSDPSANLGTSTILKPVFERGPALNLLDDSTVSGFSGMLYQGLRRLADCDFAMRIMELETFMHLKEKAYIAGIIDGEGTVTLSRAHANETPAPKVSVANNNLQLLQWIKSKVGSGIIIRRSKRKVQHGTQYVLDIYNDAALDLLNEVREYLIVKRPHAGLLVDRYKAVTSRNGRYTARLLAEKMELVLKIRRLNSRSMR